MAGADATVGDEGTECPRVLPAAWVNRDVVLLLEARAASAGYDHAPLRCDRTREVGILAEIVAHVGAGDGDSPVDAISGSLLSVEERGAAAQVHLEQVNETLQIEEMVEDKRYHAAATIELCDVLKLRTYSPERESKQNADSTDKPAD